MELSQPSGPSFTIAVAAAAGGAELCSDPIIS
jgi:hypothetical protein